MEAGGHRGAFDPAKAERELVGLMALIPAVLDAVRAPVIDCNRWHRRRTGCGSGGYARRKRGDDRHRVFAVFGSTAASCVADALAKTAPERTILSRAFSGRPERSIATDYVRAAIEPPAPSPAPYPVQRA
jgi:nitronate monooxygenase